MIGTLCVVLITIYLVRLLIKVSNVMNEVEKTTKQVNEITQHVKMSISIFKPLLETLKESNKFFTYFLKALSLIKKNKKKKAALKKEAK